MDNTILLMGGLGNQFFQLCALFSYCKQFQKSFKLYDKIVTLGNDTTRPAYFDTLFKGFQPYTTNNFYILYKQPYYREHKLPFQNQQSSVVLYGYYQSCKFFYPYFPEIRKLLNIKQQQQNIMQEHSLLLKNRPNTR